jgi:hypothetical protein
MNRKKSKEDGKAKNQLQTQSSLWRPWLEVDLHQCALPVEDY